MLTPKGFEVLVLVLRISARRASGVGWVRAVSWEAVSWGVCRWEGDGLTMPRPPALETAEASSA